jgi:hypothetical protein
MGGTACQAQKKATQNLRPRQQEKIYVAGPAVFVQNELLQKFPSRYLRR